MPYNPGIQNRGGEYIMRGIELAGQAIADGMTSIGERNKEERELDGIAPYYLKDQPDAMQRYEKASLSEKRGMIAAEHYRTAQQQRDLENSYRQDAANLDWYRAIGDQKEWKPDEETLKHLASVGMYYAPQSRHGGSYVNINKEPPKPALGSDPTGTGKYMWNGSTLVEKPDAKAKPPTEADVSFQTNTNLALKGLDDLEAAIKRNGTWENSWFGNAEDSARLSGLPYSIATQTAKIFDPASVAREGEVAAAQKYIIPLGVWASKDKALSAIDQHRSMIKQYMTTREQAQSGGGALTPAPAVAAGTAAATGKSEFRPGGVYQDAQGRKRRYNADGTWTKL